MNKKRIYPFFKRLIGIIGSLVGIIVCSALLWWWVLIINLIVTRGHPFFLSKRVGRNGKEFNLIKFRSMKLSANPTMTSHNLDTKKELTGFGKFLRKTSIDETTQLFNVFIGQMAFIGPRPLINIADDKITIDERIKNGSISLRPGISGLAQIHGREKISPLEKAQYDFEYYQKMSFGLDCVIFFSTLFGLF